MVQPTCRPAWKRSACSAPCRATRYMPRSWRRCTWSYTCAGRPSAGSSTRCACCYQAVRGVWSRRCRPGAAARVRVRRRLRLLHPAGVGTGRGDAALARWRGRTGVAGVAALACLATGAVGGPVAAAVAGVYTALICAAWLSRRQASRIGRDRLALVDAIAMLGADLRAGLAPAAALAEAQPTLHAESGVDGQRERSLRRFEAAWRLSDQLGAPLADLLDRVEYDL